MSSSKTLCAYCPCKYCGKICVTYYVLAKFEIHGGVGWGPRQLWGVQKSPKKTKKRPQKGPKKAQNMHQKVGEV